MSKVRSLITGWVGYERGGAVLLEAGQEVEDTDQIVQERPELFTEPEKPVRPATRRKATDG